jgi:hypothetical protein
VEKTALRALENASAFPTFPQPGYGGGLVFWFAAV